MTLPPVGDLGDPGAGPSTARPPRSGDDANFDAWLGDFAAAPAGDDGAGPSAPPAAGDDDSGSGGGGGGASAAPGGSRRGSKRGRPMTDAAVAKANRERARRERLNEFLDELARLCDPSGKGVKGDRVSVVADAIRVVQQLRVENNQLKQLNKFLEERTGQLERARAQAMFQHAAAAQMQMQQAAAAAVAQAAAQQATAQQAAAAAEPAREAVAAAAAPPAAPPQHAQHAVQHMLVPVPIGSLGAQVMAIKQEHLGAAGVMAAATAATAPAATAGMPPGAPPVAWLPAPDLTQDQKLRPPAA